MDAVGDADAGDDENEIDDGLHYLKVVNFNLTRNLQFRFFKAINYFPSKYQSGWPTYKNT